MYLIVDLFQLNRFQHVCVPKFGWAIAEAMQFEFGHERKSIVSFILNTQR